MRAPTPPKWSFDDDDCFLFLLRSSFSPHHFLSWSFDGVIASLEFLATLSRVFDTSGLGSLVNSSHRLVVEDLFGLVGGIGLCLYVYLFS